MKALVRSCFRGIPTDAPVIVAVSGGSDSLALLLLANAWARESGAELLAVTVDHGLRQEAAAEAAFVASVAAGLGIEHVTLGWEGEKPAFGIQEAARTSRYALIDDLAHETGSTVILTGHTLDDQAETVFMRAQRGGDEAAGGRGLSGMARQTWLYGGTMIFRPLLAVSRQTLRRVLSEFSQPWIEDPSNEDTSYERVRVRKLLASRPVLANQALALAAISGRLRSCLARDCARFLSAHVDVTPGPVFSLRLPASEDRPVAGAVTLLALRVLIALAGGREHLAGAALLKTVAALPGSQPGTRVTAGGAVIERTAAGMRFYRELRNLGSIAIDPGETAIWDGRLHVHNASSVTVFCDATRRSLVRELEESRDAPFSVRPRQALWSSPVLHVQSGPDGRGGGAFLPLAENRALPAGLHARIACPAIEHFCPEFDAPLREWVLSLDRHTTASLQPGN